MIFMIMAGKEPVNTRKEVTLNWTIIHVDSLSMHHWNKHVISCYINTMGFISTILGNIWSVTVTAMMTTESYSLIPNIALRKKNISKVKQPRTKVHIDLHCQTLVKYMYTTYVAPRLPCLIFNSSLVKNFLLKYNLCGYIYFRK